MVLQELEYAYIQPLTRAEKWQLIADIQEMLKREEEMNALWTAEQIFTPGKVYEIATPLLSPHHDETNAAAQLQTLLEGTST